MDFQTILATVAPIAANVLTAVIIPTIVKNFSVKKLQERINEVNSGNEFKELKKEIKELKKEIKALRGR